MAAPGTPRAGSCSESSSAAAAPMCGPVADMSVRGACGKSGAATEMEYRGKQVWHNDCVLNYKQHQKKWKARPHLKSAWQGKSTEEKQQWFVEERAARQHGLKRTYDDIELSEQNRTSVGSSMKNMEDYLTWDEWYIRGKALDKQPDVIKQEWDEALMDDSRDKVMVNSEWCVYVFRGVAKRSGASSKMEAMERSAAKVRDEDHLSELRDQASQSQKRRRTALVAESDTLASAESIALASRPEPPKMVPEHLVARPTIVLPENVVSAAISRDVQKQASFKEWLAKREAEQDKQALEERDAAMKDRRSEANASKVDDINTLRSVLVEKLFSTKGSLQVFVTNIATAKAEAQGEYESAAKEHVFDQDLLKQLDAQRDEMNIGADAQVKALELQIERLAAIDVPALKEIAEVKQALEDVLTQAKNMRTQASAYRTGMKNITTFQGSLRRTVTQLRKEAKKKAEGDKNKLQDAGGSAPVVAYIVDNKDALLTQAENTFDVKGMMENSQHGVKEVDQAFSVGLKKVANVKRTIAFLKEHLTQQGKTYAPSYIEQQADLNKVTALIAGNVESDLCSKWDFEDKDMDWARAVHGVQAYASAPGHETLGSPPFCLGEVRVLLSGAELHMGIAYDKVQGSTYSEKLEWLKQASGDELAQAIKSGGFIAEVKEGHMVYIPHGYLLAQTASSGSTGLRWGVRPGHAIDQVTKPLSDLLQSFPGLGVSQYGSWSKWLKANSTT